MSPMPTNAAEWVVRMRSGTLSRRERQAMQLWLDKTPENARELLRTETAWRLAGTLTGQDNVAQELAELDALTPAVRRWNFLRPSWAGAAAVLVIAAGITGGLWLTPDRYTTERGEQRVITLADGSIVALNTDTVLVVDFTREQREIVLKRGEAMFQVAPETARPFFVRAGNGYARALGTRFNVLMQEGAVTVAVLEGRVEVANEQIGAGQATAYSFGKERIAPEPVQASPERIAAWREGKLRFESWRLDRAIREYNRYARKPVRLDSPRAAQTQISGVFRIGDSSTFVEALGKLVDAQVRDTGDELVLIPQ